ncbi:Golgin imh1 [Coemansia sp. RSA 2522]|nr:Golgin imh1 [Coemansia sp. RSA 2522]
MNGSTHEGSSPLATDTGDSTKLTSDTLRVGDVVNEQLLGRLAKLEKYEHKLAEVARVYRNLNAARKAVETVLKKLTPVQSIADVDELEQFLSNLTVKSQYAGEQIGALTELDKTNRAKIQELESKVTELKVADMERQTLKRDFENSVKERKVVEGQLERSNQKLKLDISALEAQVQKLSAEAKSVEDPAGLANKLTALLSAGAVVDSQHTTQLQTLLVEKCGVPDGLVQKSELDDALVSYDAAQQEALQTKTIIRGELAEAEKRLEVMQSETQEQIADMQQQIEQLANDKVVLTERINDEEEKNSELKADADKLQSELESLKQTGLATTATDGLTASRAADIIAAAVAHNVTGVAHNVTAVALVAADDGEKPKPGVSGKKKGGKNKRRNTASSSKAPSPAAQVAAQVMDEPVAVTKEEIGRLIELVETVASATTGSEPSANSEPSASSARVAELDAQIEELRTTADDLRAQLKESKQAAELAAKDADRVDELQANVARLDSELGAAAAERDRLQTELDAANAKLVEAQSQSSRQSELEQELDAAQTQLAKVTESHVRELEAKESELKQLEAAFDGAKSAVRAAESRVAELEAELKTSSAKLAEAEAMVAKLKQATDGFGEERSRLASSLAKAQGANVRLEGKQKELHDQVSALTGDVATEQKRVEELRAAKTQADTDIAQGKQTVAELERQLSDIREMATGLEAHVRAVDADLANSREQFAEKSRQAAQAAVQVQELQYSLEKERRGAKSASEDARKELVLLGEQLDEARRLSQEQSAQDASEINELQQQLRDLDQRMVQEGRLERLEAQRAEKEAELEAVRSTLQQTENGRTQLQVEVDRLRDIERDLQAAKEQLSRVTDERKMSEQRWKRVHRDLKEEVRRLHRERQTAQPSSQSPGNALTSPPSRSNSMTVASVSSLLRAATGNAANVQSGQGARRLSIPHYQTKPVQAPEESSAAGTDLAPEPHTQTKSNSPHTRTSSNAGSGSDAGSYDERSETINVEYLRNVLFRFFNDKDRRSQLVPVLSTLLNCKVDDVRQFQLMLQ